MTRLPPLALIALLAGACGAEGALAPDASDGVADDVVAPDVAAEDVAALPDVSEPPPDAGEVPDAGPDPAVDHADWMHELIVEYDAVAPRLVDICFPRAHDAGTYELTWCSIGAVACNTQTQHLDMTAMLEAGVRGFDVRPQTFGDQYVSHHTTACDGLGCDGDWIQSMAAQTRAFLEEHRELVIWELSHYCHTGPSDEALVQLLQDELGDTLYTEPEPVDAPFIQRPLRDIVPPDGATGKILLLWGGVSDTADNRAAGLFPNSFVPRQGGWSNKQHLEDLVADQLARYAAFDHDGDAIFELSWTMTMDADLAVACLTEEDPRSIESMADETNGVLASNLDALIASGGIAKGQIPHVLSVDYADTFVTVEALRLSRLNLD